jgi:hypothetical protein
MGDRKLQSAWEIEEMREPLSESQVHRTFAIAITLFAFVLVLMPLLVWRNSSFPIMKLGIVM